MEYNSFLELVKKRRSIRLFKPDPIPEGSIEKIIEAARWAMSGGNGQPWEFVVVKDPETKTNIARMILDRTNRHYELELTRLPEYRHTGVLGEPSGEPGERQAALVNSAPVVIVVCGDPRTFQATVIGNQFFSGEQDIFHMNLGNAAQILCLAAVSLGLGTAWQTIAKPWEMELKLLLGIPREFRIYMIISVGYQAYIPAPSYRREVSEIVHYGSYDQSKYRSDKDISRWLAELRKKVI